MNTRNNPLLENFDTPNFSQIKLSDYKPAIEQSIEEAQKNINSIIENPEEANFENTIEALEFASYKLDKITTIFFNLNSANTSDEMQELALELSPILTTFSNDVSLNEDLFKRVEKVYNNTNFAELSDEKAMLLKDTYKGFVRNGVNLLADKKAVYRQLSEELAQLSLQFSQNVLNATNAYYLHLQDESELEGLPEFVRQIGEAEAQSKELKGWVFTLAHQSYLPFMQYSSRRDLREKLWTKFSTRSFENDKNDNQEIILKITSLRRKYAELFGLKNFSQYVLEERMSKTQQTVETFLEDLVQKTMPFAEKDCCEVKQFAKDSGFEGELMPWDFGFYAEKLKMSKYDISDDKLKPYFSLDSVQQGLFDVLNKLYGIDFVENTTYDKYHKDMLSFDVVENGKKLAILYIDYFPRETKSGGAWMTSYRDRVSYKEINTLPIISIVCNFTKPTQNEPSLLTFNEVTTLFHETGHALHGIFAEGSYPSISGTNVAWDFVELPSQIMENWAIDTYFLSTWAKHYKTGESIPQEYIDKLIKSENFLSGYAQMRQLSFGTSDMAWHTIEKDITVSVKEFESKALEKTQILPKIQNSCVSTTFSHIFAGGYAAGYYSYKWAEVLEADAFSMFKEKGVYNRECADSFRKNILSKGGQKEAIELYKAFRGREPQSEALFEKLGLVNK